MRILLFVLFTSAFLAVGSIVGQDPVKVAPKSYKVLLENEQVRVLKGCLNPGEKIPMHSHEYRVIYELTDHTSRFTFPAVPPVESRSSAGEVKWGTPVTHSEENIGKTEGCALIVELKQPQTSHSRQP
jgi:beta-alanine degradation protein BauB